MFDLLSKVKWYERILGPEGDTPEPGQGNSDEGDKVTVMAIKDPRTGKPVFKTLDGKPLFTQDHMNYEIGEARKKEGEKNKTLIKQLEELRDNSTTSDAVRNELQSQIEDLKKAGMTQQQQAEMEMKRLQRQYEKDTKAINEQAQSWQQRYTKSFISQEIRRSAVENKALPLAIEQLDIMLGGQAVLRPIKDSEGKDIPDAFEAVVNFRDTDESGSTIQTILPIGKAMARMRELPQRFGNLFESDQKGGVGGGTMMGQSPLAGKSPNFKDMTMEQYKKWREANPEKVGETR